MTLVVQIKKNVGTLLLEADFSMNEENFGILGASGSGKSMTLKCIAGIETPDEGRIVLNDRVLFDSKGRINLPPQKRKVGYLFQDYALFPNMTVRQNLMAGMGKNPATDLVDKMMERFRLEGLEQHYPSRLSGGQKQRVAMARMFLAEPEVLLMDEPFSALDTYLRWELELEMQRLLGKCGKPVVFVSHNRNEVYRLCQRVSCMDQGHLMEPLPTKEFFKHPRTREEAKLSGCKNISEAEWVDETHIYARDWNVILQVKEHREAIRYVGICAHSFQENSENGSEENTFPVGEPQIIEEPFEWNVIFRTGDTRMPLLWKVSKNSREDIGKLPKSLSVNKDDILLLK